MNNLEYLDMVVHETVRMHPTVPILWRVCTKEYHTTVRGRPLSIYKARLPEGYSQIFRSYVFGPPGLKDYGSATLRCKI